MSTNTGVQWTIFTQNVVTSVPREMVQKNLITFGEKMGKSQIICLDLYILVSSRWGIWLVQS